MATALAAAQLGCPAQPIKPTQQSCPAAAVETMRRRNLYDNQHMDLVLDVNQPDLRGGRGVECKAAGRVWQTGWCLALVGDGQIESKVHSDMGYPLPPGSRLYGRLWTEGETVVGRYTRARLPDGSEIDVCVSLSLNGGAEKQPGSKPGAALVIPRENARIIYGQWP